MDNVFKDENQNKNEAIRNLSSAPGYPNYDENNHHHLNQPLLVGPSTAFQVDGTCNSESKTLHPFNRAEMINSPKQS